MVITLTNNQIYNYANSLLEAFETTQKFPIKVNFYLQKNQTTLLELAKEIEELRLEIAKECGTLNAETQQYQIAPEKADEATKRIKDLFDITQEVNIYKVSLNDFGNLELTAKQMQALMFMIEESTEEE